MTIARKVKTLHMGSQVAGVILLGTSKTNVDPYIKSGKFQIELVEGMDLASAIREMEKILKWLKLAAPIKTGLANISIQFY